MNNSKVEHQRPKTGYGHSQAQPAQFGNSKRETGPQSSKFQRPQVSVTRKIPVSQVSDSGDTPRSSSRTSYQSVPSPRRDLISLNTSSLINRASPTRTSIVRTPSRSARHVDRNTPSKLSQPVIHQTSATSPGSEVKRTEKQSKGNENVLKTSPSETDNTAGNVRPISSKRAGRPKSSYGIRKTQQQQQPVPSQQSAGASEADIYVHMPRGGEVSQEEPRPKTSRSRRPPDNPPTSPILQVSQNFADYPSERPKTSRSRRQAAAGDATYGQVSVSASFDQYADIERPKTSRGSRPQTEYTNIPLQGLDSGVYSPDLVRPTTSRGRRQHTFDTSGQSYEEPGGRPPTRRAIRDPPVGSSCQEGPALEEPPLQDNFFPPPSQCGVGEVDILRIESGEEFHQGEELLDEEEELNTNTNAGDDEYGTGMISPDSKSSRVSHPSEGRRLSNTSADMKDTKARIEEEGPSRGHYPYPSPRFGQPPTTIAPQTSPRGMYTPPEPPAGTPTDSSKGRSSRYRSARRVSHEDRMYDTVDSPTSRPSSAGSMSPYSILPAIGSTKPGRPHAAPPTPRTPTTPTLEPTIHEMEGLKITEKSSQNGERKSSEETKVKASVPEAEESFQKLTREIALPPEPSCDEEKFLLAVKLPDGQRVQRNFSLLDTLQMVLNFAEQSAALDFTGCDLVCAMPKQVFHDLTVMIKDTGLENRTVLYIDKADD